ncbi:MAG: TRAP transporter TatT component family protein [Thermoanaerobaculales bacterium]
MDLIAMARRCSPWVLAAWGAGCSLILPGCSVKTMAINALSDALAGTGSSWASDNDPELVRDATPFALKTIESLVQQSPRHRGLLLAAASGFTEYAYAFVQTEADYLETRDLEAATAMRRRAVNLYLSARDYGLRGLEIGHPGLGGALRTNAVTVLASVRGNKEDVALLYWTAAPWAGAISLAKENAELAVDLPVTGAMMRRALALDEGFDDGAIYDFLISYDGSLPASAGGSVERARHDLDKALALSKGRRAAPLVSFAEAVSVATQDRKEFVELLNRALAVDLEAAPQQRLANLIAQKRARWLLARVDELFIE